MRPAAALAGAATTALVAGASLSAWRAGSPVAAVPGGAPADGAAWWFLIALAAAFCAYLLGLAAIHRHATPVLAVAVVAAAIQLVPVASPLLLSTDAWTYWSYGWIGGAGDANPYRDEPAAVPGNPALSYMGAAWQETTSVYGPLFTAASQPLASVASGSADRAAWTYKALAGAAALAAALLAGRVARRRALAVAFVGWNPVLAIHLGGGGHNDAWVGALVAGALAMATMRRLQAAGVLWSLAIFVKWVPAVLLALRAIEARATGRRTRHLGFAVATAAAIAAAIGLYGLAWLSSLRVLGEHAVLETSYAIPSRLEQAGLPGAVTAAVTAAVLLGGLALLARDAHRGRAHLGLAACLLMLTTPYLAVWYLGWAVPVVAADGDRVAGAVCLALCAYLLPQTIPLS